ncbi:hypothetical protein [Nonomuraea sp. NPDC048916]|uniref:hypothetical protein n=1 Tax=Nonomuraea sp. NPDC048916 TaxID=3154232 RepID=UPI0033EB4286
MRRLAPVILVLALAGCGPAASPGPGLARFSPVPAAERGPTLTCGSGSLTITYLPEGLTRGRGFAQIRSLTEQLKVRGASWHGGGEELRVGVVCGVRSPERFASLVTRSALSAHLGKPALRWRTRGDVRNYMWLERPGTAVYVSVTPGLARELDRVASGVVPGS